MYFAHILFIAHILPVRLLPSSPHPTLSSLLQKKNRTESRKQNKTTNKKANKSTNRDQIKVHTQNKINE